MTIQEKIRQLQCGTGQTPIREPDSLSPVSHVAEPVGRESVVHALLARLEPAFDGQLPPNVYVWGPMGAGKSALFSALFHRLERAPTQSEFPTATHSQPADEPAFLYADARRVPTRFSLFRAILDELVDDSVPGAGVETAALHARIRRALSSSERRLVLAVDHVGEPETFSVGSLASMLESFESSVAWLAIGRSAPASTDYDGASNCLQIPAYRRGTLAEIVRFRADAGLDSNAITDDQIGKIASWADGNAHDALTALWGGATLAADRGRTQIRSRDLVDAITDIPQPAVPLGRVMELPQNRRRVLRGLVDAGAGERESVATAAETVADGIDLCPTTVERFLYELADAGIIERVRRSRPVGRSGRPPSRLKPRFPPTVFKQLPDPDAAP